MKGLSIFLLAASCSDSGDDNVYCVGAERCACYGNGTCDTGLECRSGLCVGPATGGSSGAPNAGGSDSSGGSAQAGDNGSPGGGPGNGGANSAGGSSGGVAGSGGSGGGSGCNPLVWLVVAKSSGMYDSSVGSTPAFDVIVDALVGTSGAVNELDAQMDFALTLVDGPLDGCPVLTTINPASDNTAAIQAALEGVTNPGSSDTPMPEAYDTARALLAAEPSTRDRYMVVIHHSTPDFCGDGNPLCPRDRMYRVVQNAFYDNDIRTFVVGVNLPTGDNQGAAYFQGLANAGAGLTVLPFVEQVALEQQCQPGPWASYNSGDPGDAEHVFGDDTTVEADFIADVKALIAGLACQ